jgi:hypothetical protein
VPPSPIKDPHDFRCASSLKKIIPRGTVVNTALFFSGQLEFALAGEGRLVQALTTKYVVYEFWKCAFQDPHRIIKIAEFMNERRDPLMLHYMQEDWPTYKDPYVRSCMFFLLNRFSSTGAQSKGALSYENYNPVALNRLKNIDSTNFTINLINSNDFIKPLSERPSGEYIVLPIGEFSYNFFEHGKNEGWETTKVDHTLIKDFLKETEKKTIIVYKWHEALDSFFNGFPTVYLNEYGTSTTDASQAREVLIANFRIS